ncbi:MAG: 4-(cytidine 5'-diphospho)-2-C-methyl-D-erythritol kinase [Gemmatimonadaceae bacterium]
MTGSLAVPGREVQLQAAAKVNLRLRVLEREPSGYHQLETIFLRIALADVVRVRALPAGRSLDCGGPALPASGLGPVEQNLAWRAAAAYADASGWPGGFALEIEKHIPVGGGLGGGSADAGAVLRALESIAPRPLGEAGLASLAASLGSDVRFLTSGMACAIGRGRGERLEPLPAPPTRPLVLVIPPFAVNTAEAYGWVAAARAAGELPLHADAPLDARALGTWDALARAAANDFEPLVAARHPEIATAARALRDAGATVALMSGSGSTVFGVFEGAAPAALSLPPEFRIVRTTAPSA